jgi:hypothetical protein
VKKSGRDEPRWVSIYKCMEAMLGISLYSCLYLKLAKNTVSFLLSFMFSLQQIEEQEGRIGSAWKQGWSGVGWGEDAPNNVYTCK